MRQEYNETLKLCKAMYDPSLFNYLTAQLPKFIFTEAKAVQYLAFKACGRALLTCKGCGKINIGANMALLAKREEPGFHEVVCNDCFVKDKSLRGHAEITVFSVSYESAKQRWQTVNLAIVYGFAKPINMKMFTMEGCKLLFSFSK